MVDPLWVPLTALTPQRRYPRWGLYLLAASIGGLVIWADTARWQALLAGSVLAPRCFAPSPFKKRPGLIEPCIPTLASRPPVGPQWVHEIKRDG
jgi:hypothetical protein